MSHFEGYMGGDAGQGYSGANSTSTSGYPYVGGGAGDGFQPSAAAPPPPQPPTQAPQQTPNSAGSITQFYQPTQPQLQTLAYSSPQVGHGANTSYRHQNMHQTMMQPQQQQYQQHSVPYGQHSIQQPVAPQPTASAQPSIATPQAYPQQPGIAYSQNVAQQQTQTMLTQQSLVSPQSHPQQTMHTGDTGSYAARSAQAFATVGTPSPTTPVLPSSVGSTVIAQPVTVNAGKYDDTPAVQAQQNRILTDCTRKVQEHAYYMKQAMDKDELSTVLDRASHMVGELGDASSGLLTPKNYYELHMRALDDMPNLEEYFLSLTGAENSNYTMKDLYGYVQYCPRVLPRLYLQISAGSALIRSKEESAKQVLNDLIEAVKCVQNPLRGLFLRHFLLQVTRDKLPDGDVVQDAYEFVLANFIEMNRLWVRIQHLPGDGKSKEQRKRRERERNELRILVGTNLVRLSQLEGVSSKIYGEIILPKILEQITACGDPLAQAYLIDCIIQVFPDEYHIETLPILLAVCPKLRDKVNVRTIMQSLMDRLANYYADEELLDEADTNEVKKTVARDSFPMFEECVEKVFHARGPKLVSREVIRLQTALLNFSLKCYPGNMEQVSRCLGVCIDFIRQAASATAIANQTPLLEDSAIKLDQASITELEKMLSIPLDSLALKVLELNHYSDLLQFLPWENRRDVGMIMLRAIDTSGVAPTNVNELEELFSIILPVIRDQESADIGAGRGQERMNEMQEENNLVSKLVHLLDHKNVDVAYEMLSVARSHLSEAGNVRMGLTLVPVVFSALRLANKVAFGEGKRGNDGALSGNETAQDTGEANDCPDGGDGEGNNEDTPIATEEADDDAGEETGDAEAMDSIDNPTREAQQHQDVDNKEETQQNNPEGNPPSLTCRKVLLFVQTTIAMLSKGNPELGVKLYLQTSLAADNMFNTDEDSAAKDIFQKIVCELLTQGFSLYEEEISDSKAQQRCIVNMVGNLLACQSVSNRDYENFITKAAQYAAKLTKKQDQCEMVALCSHLFYSMGKEGENGYQNPQRTLECLQRSLKLADTSATSAPSNVYLFVDLLENYLYFYEENNPVITEAYITGLLALIREHLDSLNGLAGVDASAVADARSHFFAVLEYIKRMKNHDETAERFAQINIGSEPEE